MRVVVAIDSFKGSLSSIQAGAAVKEAALKVSENAEVFVCPLADGGEGTVDAVASGLGGQKIKLEVSGPLLKSVEAEYCILPNGVAVIEMASAAGITLISENERNPLQTTTYGVGEIIKDAIEKGCRDFIVGIGGSATNDGGTGMLQALGYQFLDKNGKSIALGAKGLEHLSSISDETVLPQLKECKFKVACDVTNTLCGKNGCSAVFGKQKGATEQMIQDMDKWLYNYAEISKRVSPKANAEHQGVGAAGGLGFAFMSFTNATLASGIEIILKETKMEEIIKTADLVVTGEGRLDAQTVCGKAPIGVAKLAKKYGKKVIAFSGCVSEDAVVCNEYGIDAYFSIARGVTTLENAMKNENAYKNLVATAQQVFRLLMK